MAQCNALLVLSEAYSGDGFNKALLVAQCNSLLVRSDGIMKIKSEWVRHEINPCQSLDIVIMRVS